MTASHTTTVDSTAVGDPGRRFDDVFNLVYHPDFLTVAWERVAGNKVRGPPEWTG